MATATLTPENGFPCFTIDDDDDDETALNMFVDDETQGAIQLRESNPVSTPSISHHPLPEESSMIRSSLSNPPIEAYTAPNHSPSSNNTTLLVHPAPTSSGTNLGYHPEILDLKVKRKRRTATLGVIGGVAGLLLLGPIGGIAVGASAAICTKAVGKRKEKNKVREIRKQRALAQAMEEAEQNAQHQHDHEEGALDHSDDSTAVTTASDLTTEPTSTA